MPPKTISEIDLERGKRFTEMRNILRKKIGKSRDALGEALGGYSEGSIRNWENGQPIANFAIKSLIALGCNIEWLMTGEGEMMRQSSSAGSISSLSLPTDLSPGEIRAMAEKLLRLADKLEELN